MGVVKPSAPWFLRLAKVSGFVGSVDRHINEQVTETKSHLMSRNLPAALEAMEPAQGLPEDVWTRIKDVQYKGGAKALLDTHAQYVTASHLPVRCVVGLPPVSLCSGFNWQ